MTTSQNIAFKDPLWIRHFLDTALKKEKEKYKKCPVGRDMVPDHEAAEWWGFVVTGYCLLEQSLKALLYVRGKVTVPATHTLCDLFGLLDEGDKDILREYYTDYKGASADRIAIFPFSCLDDFLVNLDGGENEKGKKIGSFDWRYFLIEQMQGQKMPLVSVDYLHEIVYGTNSIVEYAHNGKWKPSGSIYSYRLRWDRREKYRHWLTVRMNSEGWSEIGDRLEILWGPDYRGRYDLFVFRGESIQERFSDIPKGLNFPVIDKRADIEAFDVEEGYRSVGIYV